MDRRVVEELEGVLSSFTCGPLSKSSLDMRSHLVMRQCGHCCEEFVHPELNAVPQKGRLKTLDRNVMGLLLKRLM